MSMCVGMVMLIDGLPYALPYSTSLSNYSFYFNRLLPLLAESPTSILKEMSSCKVVYKQG